MHIGFHAPLKPPDHPTPSGDRRVALLLIAALERGGHRVSLLSRFRSFNPKGEAALQQRLEREARAEAERIEAAVAADRPDIWLTYHCYYKAPDLIGPGLCDRLGIPYVIHEPSHAPKRASGAWAAGHRLSEAAIRRADLLLCPTHLDLACVGRIAAPERLRYMPPFLDTAPFAGIAHRPARASLNFPDRPCLLAVGMMRAGDKLESYRRLGAALALILDRDWDLMVVGDGEARPEVEAALAPLGERVTYAGALPPADLARYYAAADLLVWPAAGEAYGMAFLEAAAAGLPAVAGRVRGVPEVVIDGRTGLLVEEDDASAFAAAVARLLDDSALRGRLGEEARHFARTERSLEHAAAFLDRAFRALRP